MANRVLNDRYELLRPLSTDALGSEFYAWDHEQRRAVLVLEIVSFPTWPATVADQFVRDVQRLPGLHHPNVESVVFAGRSTQGRVYLVRGLLDAVPVDLVLSRLTAQNQRLALPLAAFIARDVFLGLAAAHSLPSDQNQAVGLVHGAMTARTVVLTASGAVLVTDFGLGRARRSLSEIEHGPTVPDRIVTAQADNRAVGFLMHDMIVPRNRAAADEDAEFRRQPDWERLDQADSPVAFQQIIRQLLEDGMGGRTPDALEFARSISGADILLPVEESRAMVAQCVANIQTESEIEERRRLLLLRGSDRNGERISATSLESERIAPRSSTVPEPDRVFGPASIGPGHETTSTGSSAPEPYEDLPPPLSSKKARRSRSHLGRIALVLVLAYLIIEVIWRIGPLGPVLNRLENALPPIAVGTNPKVESIPTDADVWINGVLFGRTPQALGKLDPGPLAIRIEYPGFQPVDTVLIVPNSEDIGPLPVFVLSTRIRFSSIPQGASIRVNGHELSDLEAASYQIAATDTVDIDYMLPNEEPLPTARFTPLEGLLATTDTTVWHWQSDQEPHGGRLLGVFQRTVSIESEPPGGSVYVDEDSASVGTTPLSLLLPYGNHRVRIQRDPFMDYVFDIVVNREAPDRFAVALHRTVHLRAVEQGRPDHELAARIEWIREGQKYVKTPMDGLTTPYSLQLEGRPHEIHFSLRGFRDTTVFVSPQAQFVNVALRPAESGTDDRAFAEMNDNQAGWVRFVIKGDDGPVAGAEVIGIEKTSGLTLRYGLTDAAGEYLTRVPVGDYDWQASKPGFEGRTNGERISNGRLKTITLRLKDRKD